MASFALYTDPTSSNRLSVITFRAGSGETSVLGVTAEHPLHSGEDWVTAGDLAPGDLIADQMLLRLTVLAVQVDDTP